MAATPLQVLAVTKGGTNALPRNIVGVSSQQQDGCARIPLHATKPKLIRNQYGYSVGGPVIKDKTFFFTSYEGTKIRTDSDLQLNSGSNSFLQRRFLIAVASRSWIR